MGPLRAVHLAALLLVPGLAFCHKLAPPPPPPPPPAPPPSASTGVAPRDPASLIPRKVLLGDPQRSQVQISPDGKTIGWLAPVNGALNVVVAPCRRHDQAQTVTHQPRSIGWWRWTYRSDRILFSQDRLPADESEHVFAVDLAKNETQGSDAVRRRPRRDRCA